MRPTHRSSFEMPCQHWLAHCECEISAPARNIAACFKNKLHFSDVTGAGQVVTQCSLPFSSSRFSLFLSLIISHLCIPQRCRYGFSGETPPHLSPCISASRSSPCPINAGKHITCDCRQTVCDSICLVCLAWSRQGRKRTIWTIAFPSHAAGVVQWQINTSSHLEKARSQELSTAILSCRLHVGWEQMILHVQDKDNESQSFFII